MMFYYVEQCFTMFIKSRNDRRTAPSADVSSSSVDIVASNGECFMMFHNVLRVFHYVFLVVHDVLRVVHNVLYVVHDVLLCLASRATIGIDSSATAPPPPIASGIATTPQG